MSGVQLHWPVLPDHGEGESKGGIGVCEGRREVQNDLSVTWTASVKPQLLGFIQAQRYWEHVWEAKGLAGRGEGSQGPAPLSRR